MDCLSSGRSSFYRDHAIIIPTDRGDFVKEKSFGFGHKRVGSADYSISKKVSYATSRLSENLEEIRASTGKKITANLLHYSRIYEPDKLWGHGYQGCLRKGYSYYNRVVISAMWTVKNFPLTA